VIYDIRHKTTFIYEDVVSVSHHVLHLTPRPSERQRCLACDLSVDPTPAVNADGADYFGNPVRHLTVQEPHERLVVDARARVEVLAPLEPLAPEGSEPWETVRQRLLDEAALLAYEFSFDSPYAIAHEDVYHYAALSFEPGRPILAATIDLTGRIFRDFEYRGGVSDVSTPVRDVFAMRKGVCQDFAHLQIACLRSLGLAARYVSGYLLTRPPEGKEKLIGSDASHAWLSVWAETQVGSISTHQQPDSGRRAHHGRVGPRLRRREPDQRLHRRRRLASGDRGRRRQPRAALEDTHSA
jgi:transglutaminase-like putative cysteine protease